MINDIIKGIAEKIRTIFPSKKYRLYTESVEQGLKEPCFFILAINQKETKRLGVRYREDYSFAIHYFPGSNDINAECLAVAEELNGVLEYIKVKGDLVQGRNISSKVSDAVLMFLVDYTVFIRREKAKDEYMEEVEINGRTWER